MSGRFFQALISIKQANGSYMRKAVSPVILIFILLIFMMLSGCVKKTQNHAMDEYNRNISELSKSHNANLPYVERGSFKLDIDVPRGIAVDSDDNIYVVGDKALLQYMPNGSVRENVVLVDAPYAVTVSNDDTIYVAFQDKIRRYISFGSEEATSEPRSINARFVSISCDQNSLWVGDAGSREIVRYDLQCKPIGSFGKSYLLVPSAHLDVIATGNGRAWIVNPGKHLVNETGSDGKIYKSWGKTSPGLDGFIGCCNPTDIALTSSGYFVTSEKGMPRVKLYDPNGKFVCIVAPPDVFDNNTTGLDLAVDSKNRILVLDPSRKMVRVFVRRSEKAK